MDRIRDLGTSRDMLGDEEDLRGLSGLVENITKVLVRDEWEGGRARCNLYPEQPIRGDCFSASRHLPVTPIFETCRAPTVRGTYFRGTKTNDELDAKFTYRPLAGVEVGQIGREVAF